MFKISVIVPIYNSELYLKDCLHSIRNQTMPSSDYEVLLINDGSKDQSLAICEEFAAMCNNWRVIDKKNEGISIARNTGILESKGQYITFIDSDDWISEDMLADLYDLMVQHDFDVLASDLLWYYKNRFFFLEGNPTAEENIQQLGNLTNNPSLMKIDGYVMGKLYRRELLLDHMFPKGLYYEDIYFSKKLIAVIKENGYGSINKYYYFYRQRENSITNSVSQKDFDLLEVYKRLYVYYKNSPYNNKEIMYNLGVSAVNDLTIILMLRLFKANAKGYAIDRDQLVQSILTFFEENIEDPQTLEDVRPHIKIYLKYILNHKRVSTIYWDKLGLDFNMVNELFLKGMSVANSVTLVGNKYELNRNRIYQLLINRKDRT